MNRGNRKALIFEDDRDRNRFVRLLAEAAKEHGVEILGDTQMGTHFHVIVLTPHANISEFMQQLEGRYAEYSNWRHQRVGHLFQGPFKAVVIEDDIHLFTAFWYVFSNPCKAGFVRRCEDWPWSTYAAAVGLRPVPSYLSISWVSTLFPAESLEISQQLLRNCMNDPQPVAAYLLAVDPTGDAALRSYISERLNEQKQPCSYRELFRPPLDVLFPGDQTHADRNAAIAVAHMTHGYKLAEIARVTGLHPTTVSKIFCTARRESSSDGD